MTLPFSSQFCENRGLSEAQTCVLTPPSINYKLLEIERERFVLSPEFL